MANSRTLNHTAESLLGFAFPAWLLSITEAINRGIFRLLHSLCHIQISIFNLLVSRARVCEFISCICIFQVSGNPCHFRWEVKISVFFCNDLSLKEKRIKKKNIITHIICKTQNHPKPTLYSHFSFPVCESGVVGDQGQRRGKEIKRRHGVEKGAELPAKALFCVCISISVYTLLKMCKTMWTSRTNWKRYRLTQQT